MMIAAKASLLKQAWQASSAQPAPECRVSGMEAP
ncbi:hypothetical protein N172_20735 [Pantoea dispersa EGD-AAK13]|nr:hypothetical protein N172_20735 [Pantoea dispersa EGD-AAK13]